MTWIGRLKAWQAIRRVRPSEERADVLGGRDGELSLQKLVGASLDFRDARILAGRRIPSRQQGRRREIDLIVCTPLRIHLIEVKNWSGELTIHHGEWLQTRRGGDVVNHGDLLRSNLQKREAVVEYLHDRGIPLEVGFVSQFLLPQVVFMNPHLVLPPAIEDLPEVVSRRELDALVASQPRKSPAERLLASVAAYCLDALGRAGRPDATRMPEPLYRRIVSALSEVGTWDQLHLLGSRMITGDLVRIQVGAKSYGKAELATIAARMPIRLAWSRGVWGFLKALTGLGSLGALRLGKTRLAVSPADSLTFHAAGEPAPTTRGLAEVDEIKIDL